MTGLLIPETLTETCKRLEHFETPRWAARAILNRERLHGVVLDPCCGTGVLADGAVDAGYDIVATDIHDWGYPCQDSTIDFLDYEGLPDDGPFSVFMNPPFSLAVEFVMKAFALGAAKIVCFQRFAWWESKGRQDFWEKYPPDRVYICGDRAPCWRHDIPDSDRLGASSPTAYAWFVWEWPNHLAPGQTRLGHIWKDDARAPATAVPA